MTRIDPLKFEEELQKLKDEVESLREMVKALTSNEE